MPPPVAREKADRYLPRNDRPDDRRAPADHEPVQHGAAVRVADARISTTQEATAAGLPGLRLRVRILRSFLLLGSAIIDFFGISVPGIRVAGGLIISTVGFRMLFPAPPAAGSDAAGAQPQDIAFTPIAMPSLAGPGSIAVVLSAAAQIKSIRPDDWHVIYVAVLLGMAVDALALLRGAARGQPDGPVPGAGGIDAMTRIFGFLLICIGMQFLLTGISDFFDLNHL